MAAFPGLHDADSASKIWRYWQRAHFHGTGFGAFNIALIAVTALSDLKPGMKRAASYLFGLSGAYPVAWLVMALLAPGMGRTAAHHSFPVTALVLVGVGCLLSGLGILFGNIVLGIFSDNS